MTDKLPSIPNNEPSIWDYLVEKIKFQEVETRKEVRLGGEDQYENDGSHHIPWFSIVGILLAIIAQWVLEPSQNRLPWVGIILYAGSFCYLVGAILRKEWQFPVLKPDSQGGLKASFRIDILLLGVLLAVLSFILFGNSQFKWLNTALWLLAILLLALAFWQSRKSDQKNLKARLVEMIKRGLQIKKTPWGIAVLAVIAVILFFNFSQLNSVPAEMVSDQAEILLDVNDILQGSRAVFFPRNTGREPLHFYLAATVMNVFKLDISFLNLKIVTVFANLLTLFFIFLLGKELGNKWVGLSSALFAGIAYWPLVLSRVGMRIVYYPLFAAPVMYFLVRGLRRQKINDLLLAGIFLGFGLYGYTPFRIVTLLVILGVVIYLLHRSSSKHRRTVLFALIVMIFISLVIFIPLLRYWLTNPEIFTYRTLSRLTELEVEFQQSSILIFLRNFWKAGIMFFWENGTIWVHSLPNRPALEVVSAAFYFAGIIGLSIRYIREHHWQDLFLLVSIPILLLPSILSLAYPAENPNLNRTAGALVPVFIVIGLSFETFARTIFSKLRGRVGRIATLITVLVLTIWSVVNNYDLVFNQYNRNYLASSWNASEIGRTAVDFIESYGSPQTVYVIGYPHWVDSRIVAIQAGFPGLDFAIFTEEIPATVENPQAKMFFLNVNDEEDFTLLQETYPSGVYWRIDSEFENKDFMVFFVPPLLGETP